MSDAEIIKEYQKRSERTREGMESLTAEIRTLIDAFKEIRDVLVKLDHGEIYDSGFVNKVREVTNRFVS